MTVSTLDQFFAVSGKKPNIRSDEESVNRKSDGANFRHSLPLNEYEKTVGRLWLLTHPYS
jgi:hypothetical protein